MVVAGKKVLVFGSGISGIGAVKLLEENGADVVLYDGNEKLTEADVRAKLQEGSKARIIIGAFPEELPNTLDLVILSPGVPTDLPIILKMKEKEIPVIGEVELAYTFGKGDVLAITGTNGKTTTTTLLGEIMKAYQDDVFVVGNIGNPYTVAADLMTEHSIAVAEMSSFQLESIVSFRPNVSAILNYTPDHLNRHYTMENYASVKLDVCKNQTEEDYLILNYDDPITRKMAKDKRVKAKVIYFSRLHNIGEGICLADDWIVLRENGEEKKVIATKDLVLLGGHNVENYMAGIAVAYYMGIPMENIVSVVKTFKGVAHRIEFVREVNGVAYYNDSKGTNPDAAIKGIQAMNRKTMLIGGGYDKKVAFDDWIQAFDGKVKQLVLIGQTAQLIADTAAKYGFTDVIFAKDLKEAVDICAKAAEPGEAVLLSPACASWGQFDNYEQRGDMFKEYVNKLGA